MREFRIEPLLGVGPARFGMSRADIESHFGSGEHIAGSRYRYLDGLFVDFDEEGLVQFIEAARSSEVSFVFGGADLHRLPAHEALKAVEARGPYDRHDPELGYSFVFPTLQLALWRSTRDDQHFESVAAGRNGYYDAAG